MQVPQECQAEPASDEWLDRFDALTRAAAEIDREPARVTVLMHSLVAEPALEVEHLLGADGNQQVPAYAVGRPTL
ncbi:hypothetical protein [Rhabdothermincola sediminis]|uniref:hypothetical protein n=1 Tax=Rhabdothermincola sediminis TaxID=2751370 RepID=UPI001AA05AE9|nr:hypothetical protein [Rhabdothermincola sediminis]